MDALLWCGKWCLGPTPSLAAETVPSWFAQLPLSLLRSDCCWAGIDKSLALERKIESRKRNFSLDLENLIFSISLSTLDFREWQQKILFPLSIFESGKKKFSFYSRFSRVWYWNSRFFSRFLRVQIESSTSFIADGSKLINLNLFQRSDFTFSHLILIQNFKPVSLRHLKYSNSECLPP